MSRFQCFIFFEKVNKEQLKMVNVNYQKWSVKKGPGSSFQSPALSQKHVRNFCHTTH